MSTEEEKPEGYNQEGKVEDNSIPLASGISPTPPMLEPAHEVPAQGAAVVEELSEEEKELIVRAKAKEPTLALGYNNRVADDLFPDKSPQPEQKPLEVPEEQKVKEATVALDVEEHTEIDALFEDVPPVYAGIPEETQAPLVEEAAVVGDAPEEFRAEEVFVQEAVAKEASAEEPVLELEVEEAFVAEEVEDPQEELKGFAKLKALFKSKKPKKEKPAKKVKGSSETEDVISATVAVEAVSEETKDNKVVSADEVLAIKKAEAEATIALMQEQKKIKEQKKKKIMAAAVLFIVAGSAGGYFYVTEMMDSDTPVYRPMVKNAYNVKLPVANKHVSLDQLQAQQKTPVKTGEKEVLTMQKIEMILAAQKDSLIKNPGLTSQQIEAEIMKTKNILMQTLAEQNSSLASAGSKAQLTPQQKEAILTKQKAELDKQPNLTPQQKAVILAKQRAALDNPAEISVPNPTVVEQAAEPVKTPLVQSSNEQAPPMNAKTMSATAVPQAATAVQQEVPAEKTGSATFKLEPIPTTEELAQQKAESAVKNNAAVDEGPSPVELAIVQSSTVLGTLPAPTPQPSTKIEKLEVVSNSAADNSNTSESVKGKKVTEILAEPAKIRPLPDRYIVVKKEHESDDIDSRLTAARTALAQGRYSTALELFNNLYRDYYDDSRVLMGRAVAMQKLGQNAIALKAYEEVLSVDPKNIEALTNMLGILKTQDRETALSNLLQLREVYPYNADITAQLGMVYGMTGDYQNAIKYLDMADVLRPGNASVLYNRAVAYDRMGKSSRAVELYSKIIRMAADGEIDTVLPIETIKKRLASIR